MRLDRDVRLIFGYEVVSLCCIGSHMQFRRQREREDLRYINVTGEGHLSYSGDAT